MIHLLLLLVIAFFSILFVLTFLAVLARRIYKNNWFARYDRAVEKLSPIIDALLAGNGLFAVEKLKKRENSIEWKAIEDLLFRALERPQSDRSAAIKLLNELGYIESYIGKLKKSGKWERALAADKLGKTGSVSAVPGLIEALGSKHADVRNIAAYSLGVIGDERAIPSLIGQLEKTIAADEDISVRIIKSSLISFGKAAVPGLIKELENPHWALRAAAMDALSEIHLPEVMEAAMERLQDSEQDIRAKAAKTLGKIGDPGAITALLESLNDNFWVVRLHASRALGLAGNHTVVPALRTMVNDPNWQVRRAAAEALAHIGGIAHVALLDIYLNGSDQYAKEQALEELQRLNLVTNLTYGILDGSQGKKSTVDLGLIKTLGGLDHNTLMKELEQLTGNEFSFFELDAAAEKLRQAAQKPSATVINLYEA